MSFKCGWCRDVGHVLTADPYNPTGICPKCRPKEFKAERAKNKIDMFAASYGMYGKGPAQAMAPKQLSTVQARERLEFIKKKYGYHKVGQFNVRTDSSLPEDVFKLAYEEEEELLELYRPDAPWRD